MKKFIASVIASGIIFALITGARADTYQADIASKMLRIHIIANSDSEADQGEKLRVRDAVLSCTNKLLENAGSLDDVRRIISENNDKIITAAQSETNYPVTLELSEVSFPTRKYDNFTLPAGKYEALRVKIGAASGQNWWCVMFPPLCVSSCEAIEVAEEAGLTAAELDMIARGETVYRYEFKFLELIDKIKSRLV